MGVKIIINKSPHDAKVLIDGEDLTEKLCIKSLSVSPIVGGVYEPATVVAEIYVDKIEIDLDEIKAVKFVADEKSDDDAGVPLDKHHKRNLNE